MDQAQPWAEPQFHQREWRFTRVGWAALTAFVVAGLVGLLGPGPISWAVSAGPAGLVTVEYQRVAHHLAEDSITMRFEPEATRDGRLVVTVSGTWATGVSLESIRPLPTEQWSTAAGIAFLTPARSPGPVSVELAFRAEELGPLRATVTVAGDETSFTQYVLP